MPSGFLPDYTHNGDDEHQLYCVLKQVIQDLGEREGSFASGFFDLGAWELVGEAVQGLDKFRLLLGKEPDIASPTIERVSLRRLYRRRQDDEAGEVPDPDALFRTDLEKAPLDPAHWKLVDGLMAFLKRDEVDVRLLRNPFLHAKAYLFPHTAIVGSSNFTRAGLSTNAELDLVTTQGAVAQQLLDWYDSFWAKADPFKDKLLAALEESKYGRPYDPYQVFIKVLYERFRETLSPPEANGAVVDLARFQEEGLNQALYLMELHDGVLIADAVGLGKTYIALRIMEHYLISKRRKGHVPKGLVVCPAQLRDSMWGKALTEYGIHADIVSQEALGRDDFDWRKYQRYDLVIVDESHNFRTPGANRYSNLRKLLSAGNRAKKVALLTATPINNSLWDLYNQLSLITRGSDVYYRDYRIPNLNGFFRMVDKGQKDIFDLLEHTTVRRSRVDIRKRQDAGEKIVIAGQEVRFPQRELFNVEYDLTSAYPNVYHEIVEDIEKLKLVPYNIARYAETQSDEGKQLVDRGEALIGIQKVLFLKRLESSVVAFRKTVLTQQAFQRRFCELLDQGKLLGAATARKLRSLENKIAASEEDDVDQDVADLLGSLDQISPDEYDFKAIRSHCLQDIKRLDDIAQWVEMAVGGVDAKCEALKELLASKELKGKKALIFSYYRDTADHVFASLSEDADWLRSIGNRQIERITGSTSTPERSDRIRRFAPVSNTEEGEAPPAGSKIDILVCTDVLSEGQNLQDAGIVINYDLHWNPVRMIQRAGRVDRLKCLHDVVAIHNFFPERQLEGLLRLVSRVNERLAKMDEAGFLDVSTLGEAVSDRSLEAIRRIRDRDQGILDALERTQELASSEDMRLPLLMFIQQMGEEEAKRIPLGIHSGMRATGRREKGIFVAFSARGQHFWRFCRSDGPIERETREIFSWIACALTEPRELPADAMEDRGAFRGRMLQAIDAATRDVIDELRQGRGARRVPPQLTGLNKRLFDALNADANRKALGEDLVQMLNNVIRYIDLRPFARDDGLRRVDRILGAGTDIREAAEALREYFVEEGHFQSVGIRAVADEIQQEDLQLLAYEVIW